MPASIFETQEIVRFGHKLTPRNLLGWAVHTFGPVARDRMERAARLLEESVEVAQAEGISEEVADRIVARTYSRPPGELHQEIGGVAVALHALAENAVESVDECLQAEWRRLLSLPEGQALRKHLAKVADGTARVVREFDAG